MRHTMSTTRAAGSSENEKRTKKERFLRVREKHNEIKRFDEGDIA
jgi:hypothetical protein